ncbi:Hint domain-containing protein [uncultured Shimia sp.]|uniref:Hint domain-containing protein n=1 Tax=uncultured Shimia sp. TaxID=573152 RepID=UPI002605BA5B|nr:Hint domain-containing protein [uncultured Shimia sp.]
MFDYDLNGDGDFDWPTAEQGYFLAFLDGDIPPLNTTLTINGIVENDNWIPTDTVVPCFAGETLIDTPEGPRSIDDLKVGDLVLTMDSGAQPIRWIGCRDVQQSELAINPKLRPIQVMAGALGHGLPKRDLTLSPQHRVLVRSPIAQRIFGEQETLIAAKKLTEIPGIFVDEQAQSVSYYHMLFDKHGIVFSEGAPTESLFAGREALNAIGAEAREEVMTLFPELCSPEFTPVAARHIPEKGKHVRELVGRHIKNQKPLLAHI